MLILHSTQQRLYSNVGGSLLCVLGTSKTPILLLSLKKILHCPGFHIFSFSYNVVHELNEKLQKERTLVVFETLEMFFCTLWVNRGGQACDNASLYDCLRGLGCGWRCTEGWRPGKGWENAVKCADFQTLWLRLVWSSHLSQIKSFLGSRGMVLGTGNYIMLHKATFTHRIAFKFCFWKYPPEHSFFHFLNKAMIIFHI